MLLSCGLGRRWISALPGLHKAVASHKVKGSSSGQCPMNSSSQTPAIHSYHAPFSLLAWHPYLSSSSNHSQYRSTSSTACPLSNYLPKDIKIKVKDMKVFFLLILFLQVSSTFFRGSLSMGLQVTPQGLVPKADVDNQIPLQHSPT